MYRMHESFIYILLHFLLPLQRWGLHNLYVSIETQNNKVIFFSLLETAFASWVSPWEHTFFGGKYHDKHKIALTLWKVEEAPSFKIAFNFILTSIIPASVVPHSLFCHEGLKNMSKLNVDSEHFLPYYIIMAHWNFYLYIPIYCFQVYFSMNFQESLIISSFKHTSQIVSLFTQSHA